MSTSRVTLHGEAENDENVVSFLGEARPYTLMVVTLSSGGKEGDHIYLFNQVQVAEQGWARDLTQQMGCALYQAVLAK